MSFNGSGTFLINSSGQPVVTGTTISSTAFNALTSDLGSGITNCLTKDGQSTPTGNIKMGAFKLTNVGVATTTGDALSYGNTATLDATTLSSTLAVTGATTLASTLGVTGATTLSSTLAVTGATTLSSTLAVTGATTLSSTLTVANLTTINSGSSSLGLVVTTQTSGSYCIQTNPISQSGTYYAMQFRAAGTQVGGINSDASTTTYNTSSDERLKDFIGAYSADDALSIIKQDPTREFTWKATGKKAVGWGAQTSHAVSADLASPGFGEPGDENWSPWGIDHGKRTPYLWAAIGGTNGILDQLVALQAQVAALQMQVSDLQTQAAN